MKFYFRKTLNKIWSALFDSIRTSRTLAQTYIYKYYRFNSLKYRNGTNTHASDTFMFVRQPLHGLNIRRMKMGNCNENDIVTAFSCTLFIYMYIILYINFLCVRHTTEYYIHHVRMKWTNSTHYYTRIQYILCTIHPILYVYRHTSIYLYISWWCRRHEHELGCFVSYSFVFSQRLPQKRIDKIEFFFVSVLNLDREIFNHKLEFYE